MVILALLLIFLLIVLGIFFFYLAMLLSIWYEAPFVPTGRRASRAMITAARIGKGERVYDLGSGDGRLVREAALCGANATGVERSHLLVLWSRAATVILRQSRIISRACAQRTNFIRGNFYNVDLSDADVVFTYLFPNVMEKLKEKFARELKPGARVISYAFKVPGWTASERIKFSPKSPAVYVYRIQDCSTPRT